MPESLTFMMGEFPAEFPIDLMYADNHMWARPDADSGTIRFGFAAYAVRLLQDVYFLDWLVEAPATLGVKQEIGSIESKKAESALYAPLPGELLRFNEQLMADPSAINVDKYGDGWLFELQSDAAPLLNPQQYVKLLDGVWEKTQRTIKGQLNQ
ncbi:MAG: glycine cleavage system protein H [Pirellulaceae bacterium]